MKKLTFWKSLFLLCALIVGSTSAWATDVDLKLGTNNQSSYSGTLSSKINWSLAKGSGSSDPYHSNASYSKIYAGNTITISAVNSSTTKISKVVLKAQSGYIQTWTASDASTVSVDGNNATWSGTPTSSITLTNSSSSQARLNTITITYTEVVSPSINASSPVNYAADITSGEISYTISNAVSGKTLSANSVDSWISNISVGTEKVTFDMEENTGAAREGKITLSYEGATSKDITINQAAAVTKYEVTIETPTNGTLVVQRSGVNVVSGSMVPDGTTLDIIVTPNEGYKKRNWQAVDASTHTYTSANATTYTINGHDVTFKANFDPLSQYNYTWNVNGTAVKSETLYEGSDVVFPEVADLGGKAFIGWVTTSTVAPNEAPSLVSTSSVKASANTTYYAVFAKSSGNIETKTDELTYSSVGVTSSSYTDWENKSFTSDAVYKGQTAGGDNNSGDAVQLRSKNSNCGIVTTTSGGKVKKVTVIWNSTTADDRTLDIYGKNTAYEEATELYNSTNQGTKIGSIVKGTSTELTISGDYTYIGMRSNDGAMYFDKISIEWEKGEITYSEYTTTIAPATVTITTAKYATYCNADSPLDFSETGITVYTAEDKESSVGLNEVTSGKVPANTPVVLYKEGADGTAINVPVIASADAIEGTNDLRVSTGTDVDYMYVLAMNPTIGFYPWTGTNLPAGKIYLQGKASYGAREFLGFVANTTTSIDNVVVKTIDENAPMYNLAGQRVNKSYKGVVIVNGKKYMNK